MPAVDVLEPLDVLEPVPPVAVKPVIAKFGTAATVGLSRSGMPVIPSSPIRPELAAKVRSVMNLLKPPRSSFRRFVLMA